MKTSRILLLVVAIVAGGLAAFLATRGDTPAPQQQIVEAKPEPKTRILVASRDIGVGERLSANMLEWKDWPENAVGAAYVSATANPEAIAELNGTVARFEIFAGDPIRTDKLVRSDQGYLSAVLTEGMRGVSIPVTAESGAGGFIVPNDRVDVVLTRSVGQSKISETILSNVKVLAIGQRLGEAGESGAPAESADGSGKETGTKTFTKDTIATLELDPARAEALVNAAASGKLALVLRSVADFVPSADDGRGQRTSQSVKIIRFGQEQSVRTGAEVTPAVAGPGDQAADNVAPAALESEDGMDGTLDADNGAATAPATPNGPEPRPTELPVLQ